MFERKLTKKITVGGVEIGALSPVSVQSMCNTKTHDVEATVEQIKRLRAAGCDIVRLAIPDMAAAEAISQIKAETDMPLVADIHFDYRLAVEAAARGAKEYGLRSVEVFVKGPGQGREAAIRALQVADLEVTMIKDVSPIPHNGCRPPKRRRI